MRSAGPGWSATRCRTRRYRVGGDAIPGSEVAAATGGALVGPDVELDGASFDSRTLRPGQLFVPLVAERDGHDFIAGALAAGARRYLTARAGERGTATAVVVADTAARAHGPGALGPGPAACVGAGWSASPASVGKTTRQGPRRRGARRQPARPRPTSASFNNEQGLPITILDAPDDTEALVLEMGMRGLGEIARLCAIGRPTIGVVTVVAAAHIAARTLGKNGIEGGLITLLRGYGFVPFGGAVVFLLGAPQFIINYLSIQSFTQDTRTHYFTLPFVAITLAATWVLGNRRRASIAWVLLFVMLAGVVATKNEGVGPWTVNATKGFWPQHDSAQQQELRKALDLIPGGAGVSANDFLVPHLSERPQVYTFPNPWRSSYDGPGGKDLKGDESAVEWIVVKVDGFNEADRALFEQIRSSGEFDTVVSQDPIYATVAPMTRGATGNGRGLLAWASCARGSSTVMQCRCNGGAGQAAASGQWESGSDVWAVIV